MRLGKPVTRCDEGGVEVGGERIDARTIIWAAGVMASPAGQWLSVETDRAGRVKVNPDLSIPGHPEIFVLGDTAHVAGPDGRPLPGVAPVAKQQGVYRGSLDQDATEGREPAAVPLPGFRVPGDDRPQERGRANGRLPSHRLRRLADLVESPTSIS